MPEAFPKWRTSGPGEMRTRSAQVWIWRPESCRWPGCLCLLDLFLTCKREHLALPFSQLMVIWFSVYWSYRSESSSLLSNYVSHNKFKSCHGSCQPLMFHFPRASLFLAEVIKWVLGLEKMRTDPRSMPREKASSVCTNLLSYNLIST